MSETDYYQILGVSTDTEPEKIKQAYRDLAFQYHPDRNKETPEAIEKMKQINEAYAVLSNAQKRREYDGLRQTFGSSAHKLGFRQNHTEQDIFSGSDIHRILEEMAKSFGFRGYHDIFREFYGKGYQTFEVKRARFFHGVIFSGAMGEDHGHAGQLPFVKRSFIRLAQQIFEKLSGLAPQTRGRDLYEVIHIDTVLAQTGGPYAYYHRKRSKKLVVGIPVGVRDGQKIRLVGMGENGKGGAAPGDLLLKVRLKKPLLERIKQLIS